VPCLGQRGVGRALSETWPVGDLPDDVDAALWIEVHEPSHRDYLVGACHTFPGRMRLYCPVDDRGSCVSLAEIRRMSDESRRWVDGFLAGNEPSILDMFGVCAVDLYDDDPRWPRYYRAVADFRRTGSWHPAPWQELPDMPDVDITPLVAWLVRADERWRWRAGQWVLEETDLVGPVGLLAGTSCRSRGHHRLESDLTPLITLCSDCGMVSISEPE
jgi:hypothetical protein